MEKKCRQGWTLYAKIFGWFSIFMLVMTLIQMANNFSLQAQSLKPSTSVGFGNNAEAEGFAKDMTDIARETWPKGNIKWYLELTPHKISGANIVDYRKKVSYCKATISINRAEWFNLSETQQENFIKLHLRALHEAPMINLSKVLDYYPNSAGEVSIFVDNKVVATGKYAKSKVNIALQPNTYQKDEVGKFFIKINIVMENSGGIKFVGTTNIPDSQSILFSLHHPKWGRNYRQSNPTVHNGTFSTETFTDNYKPMPFGKYTLQLNAINPFLEAKGTFILPDTRSIVLTFSPTKF